MKANNNSIQNSIFKDASELEKMYLLPNIKGIDFSTILVLFLREKDDANETSGALRHSPEIVDRGLHRLKRVMYFLMNQ